MISKIISKNVIDVYKGKVVGNVLNVALNDNLSKVEGYIFFDDENDYYLPFKNIYKESEECVLIKDDTMYSFHYQDTACPINKKVYTLDGICVGKVLDVDVESGKIVKFITSFCEFLPKNIVSYGEDCLIIGEKKLHRKAPRVDFKNFNEGDSVVKILETKKEDVVPPRVTSGAVIMIGRTVESQILGFNNEIVAKEGELITNKTIELAKKHNRINELMFKSH